MIRRRFWQPAHWKLYLPGTEQHSSIKSNNRLREALRFGTCWEGFGNETYLRKFGIEWKKPGQKCGNTYAAHL